MDVFFGWIFFCNNPERLYNKKINTRFFQKISYFKMMEICDAWEYLLY